MKPALSLFIFIDACGWEIIRNDPFVNRIAPNRQRLESVFGYSSACVPSILSGRWPVEHRNWCYFVYDPEHSPFKSLRPLRWLPRALTSRRIFRRWLSRFVKVQLKFRGYFDLYNIPFRYISLFDFTEKKSPLLPGGMNQGTNIFDFLEEHHVAYHVSNPACSETENLAAVLDDVTAERVNFAFVYFPELDGLLHRVGSQSAQIPAKLRVYEQQVQELLTLAQEHYEEVHLYLFGDHGMANCDTCLDLKARIDLLPVQIEQDYAVVYDSTMARFWFFNERARQVITDALREVAEGAIMPDAELERLHCLFPDRYFGQLVFLVQEGVLIVPSHMGERPIRAMHGYHPLAKHSYAALLTNQPHLSAEITAIPHIYRLMTQEALWAETLNHPGNPASRQPRHSVATARPAPAAAAPAALTE
ncbi:MAG TPA: alkaline phosphatase family protein [Candidatus Acidoferrum sp.]|nr:alkaline phosphatase family protein [Candidatus Acidoferrum sp.]